MKKNYFRLFLATIFFFFLSVSSQANTVTRSFDSFYHYMGNEWQKSNTTDIYLPMWTWHNTHAYTPQLLHSYNDWPIGFGIGKSYLDSQGNFHGFYAMEFADSHHKIEPIVGYVFTKKVWGHQQSLNLKVGYTAFITAREDYHYIPFPAALPVVSLDYGKFSISGTYVPGGHDNGNVAFFWGQYHF
jgi:palmitoyl transferase